MESILDYIPLRAFAVLIALIVVIISYFKWKFTYWKTRGVLTPPPTIPFGNSFTLKNRLSIGENFAKMYRELKTKNLRYFGMYVFSRPIFMPIDPDLIRSILSKDFDHFVDHGNYINEKSEPLTANLFNLEGLRWKTVRAKLTPTFTSGKMKMMFHTLVQCSSGLVDVVDKLIEDDEPIDIKDVVSRYTTDVIGSCAFGIDCNSLKDPNSDFRVFGKKIFVANIPKTITRLLASGLPFIVKLFNLKIFHQDVEDFFLDVVKKTVDYREKNGVIRKDFMQLLIHLKNDVNIQDDEHVNKNLIRGDTSNAQTGKSLTLAEISAHAFTFFLAGYETSATAITFCTYELAQNPEIQNKLRNEIREVLERHNGEVTYDAMMEMTYMDKCIQETLRKYPPIPFIMRLCTKTYPVPESDLVIEKGTKLFVPLLGLQRDPEFYPNPEVFDPERFSPEGKAARHPYTWLPFGEGPRACIGLRFAMMQTKVPLAVLLKNYEFSLNSKTETPIVFVSNSAVLNAKGGVWLNAKKL